MLAFPASTFPLILTPQALSGDYTPVDQMDYLIRTLLKNGHDWDDLPPDLRSAHALDYFIGNVLNGGHSQFVYNAFEYYGVGPLRMLQDAELAAAVFGMHQTLLVIGQVRDWITTNPDEVHQQTGFSGGRAEALEPLDDALMEADMVDEAGWLAILAPLGPEVAARIATEMGYQTLKYPLKFPQPRYALHETVFLLQRQPRLIIEADDFLAAIDTIAAFAPTGTLQ